MKAKILSIGINDYQYVSPLENAVNDAKSIYQQLKEYGYEGKIIVNKTSVEIMEEVDSFVEELNDVDAVVFYYAGHGFQCKDQNNQIGNYIAGTELANADYDTAQHTSINMDEIINKLSEKCSDGVKIFIFDACREVLTRSITDTKEKDGFAPYENTPIGTLIAFSTSPTKIASDAGGNQHSVYTQALLKHIGDDCSIEDCLKKVRANVYEETSHRQISWEHTSLIGNFKFNCNNHPIPISPQKQIVTTTTTTAYVRDAYADAHFATSEISYMEMIEKFKSYNWYTQNVAILSFNKKQFNDVPIDVQFVIGRNILQAAVGGENECRAIMNRLNVYLSRWTDPNSKDNHVLNGMLYEMYFDRNAKIRSRKGYKLTFKDELLGLRQTELYVKSFVFIQEHLKGYQMAYVPGYTEEPLNVNISTEEFKDEENTLHKLTSINIQGKEWLNKQEKTEDYFYTPSMNRKEVEHKLLNELCATKDAINFKWENVDVEDVVITCNQLMKE